jgi:predicted nucleic acid-binding protein
MPYCLDTNVYIEAHRRYYAFDIAPGFWESLLHLAEKQVICSPSLVYKEIMDADYNDELAKWAKVNHDLLFVGPDDVTQQAFTEIADLVARLYEPQHVQKFLSGADPWVIAHAKAHQLMVVTQESLKNEQENRSGKIEGKILIPNVCNHVTVKYQDTFALLREQKIVLR